MNIRIDRPIKMDSLGGDATGLMVLCDPQRRICDCCGKVVHDYAEYQAKQAEYPVLQCLPCFFINADANGEEVQIS